MSSPRPSLIIDETNNTYGQLTVLSRGSSTKSGAIQWICRCSCGTEFEVAGQRLRAGTATRCLRCAKAADRRTGEGPFRKSYAQYKASAKLKGGEFPLSYEEFREFVTLPCEYCGSPPTRVRRAYNRPSKRDPSLDDSAAMHGVDRIDSSKGYEVDNIVPCCYVCNGMKSDRTTDDFLSHVERIHEHQGQTNDRRTSTSNG